MTSFRESPTPSSPNVSTDLKFALPLPVNIVISATSGSLVGMLVACRMVAHGLTQLGIGSEEIFRGDRLPTLPALEAQTLKAKS